MRESKQKCVNFTVIAGNLEGLRIFRKYGHGSHLCLVNLAQVVTDLQTSCNKAVVKLISGCVRTACSQLL
jgi:hypothetical protein